MKPRTSNPFRFAAIAGPLALMLGSTALAVDYNFGSSTGSFSITATDQARAQGASLGTFSNNTGDMGIYWRNPTATDATYMHFDLSSLAGGTIVGNVSLNQTVNAQYGGNITNGRVSTANAAWTGTGSTPGFTAIGDSALVNGTYTTGSIATWTLSNTTFQGFVNSPATFYGLVLSGANPSTAHFSASVKPTLTGTATTIPISVTGATDWSAAAYNSGTSTLAIAGSSNVTGGNVVVRSGTLSIAGAATLDSGSFAGTINNSGTLSLGSSANQTLSGVISGSGALVKSGGGTLILTGNNTYTGQTTVSAGELRLSGGAFTTTAGRTYQIDTGAVMSFGASGSIPSGANTTIQGAGTLRVLNGVSINAAGGGRKINMNLGAGAVIDVQAGGSFGLGYQPIVWTNNQATLNMDGTHDFHDDNNIIAAALTGSGTITSANAVGGSGSLTLGVNNGGGTFSGSITAAGNRVMSLVKNGTGTQIFTGSTTFRGTTTVNAGTLQYGKTSSLYAGATGDWVKTKITVNNGGMIALNVGGTNEFATGDVTTLLTGLGGAVNNNGLRAGSTIAFDTTNASGGTFTVADALANTTGTGGGAVGLTKLGTGSLVLSNTSSYSGATNVNAGKLIVNGNISTSSLTTVASGATLGGTGTVGKAIINGTLAVGNSPGQMNFTDTLGLTGSTIMEVDGIMGAGVTGGHDFVNLTGAGAAGVLTYGGSMTLDMGVIFGAGNYSWNLFDMASETGTFTGISLADQYSGNLLDADFNGVWDLTSGSDTWTFTESTGVLGLTVVPEPRAALLGGLGMLMLLRRRRA